MKITILDGYAMNPGDLDDSALYALGDLTFYERTPREFTLERMKDSQIVLTNKTLIDRDIISSCPNLRYIGVLATGYNVVDIACAKENGITVTNVPGYASQSVAQHTMALLLELTNRVGLHAVSVENGIWTKSPDFSYQLAPLSDLDGKTIGIVGCGSIGKAVARMANAFGMRVLAYTRTPFESDFITCCDFDTLLAESDVITLHCPLTSDNAKMINADAIAKMRQGAFLINTARGGLVDESALADALKTGKLGGAAVDVVSEEPIRKDNPLLGCPNLYITPHNAWASKEARQRLLDIATNNIKQFIAGKPVNVV